MFWCWVFYTRFKESGSLINAIIEEVLDNVEKPIIRTTIYLESGDSCVIEGYMTIDDIEEIDLNDDEQLTFRKFDGDDLILSVIPVSKVKKISFNHSFYSLARRMRNIELLNTFNEREDKRFEELMILSHVFLKKLEEDRASQNDRIGLVYNSWTEDEPSSTEEKAGFLSELFEKIKEK